MALERRGGGEGEIPIVILAEPLLNHNSRVEVSDDETPCPKLQDGLVDHHPPLLRRHARNNPSQVAIIGSHVCPHGEPQLRDWRSPGSEQIFQYVLLKWTLCLLVGAVTGCIGFFHNLAVEKIAGVKFVLTSNLMFADSAVPKSTRYLMAFGVFAAIKFAHHRVLRPSCRLGLGSLKSKPT